MYRERTVKQNWSFERQFRNFGLLYTVKGVCNRLIYDASTTKDEIEILRGIELKIDELLRKWKTDEVKNESYKRFSAYWEKD